MPFPPQKPKRFDRPSVEQLRAGAVGCYGLFRQDRWVYIGKGNIRERLLAHLDGDSPSILEQHPTHWVAVEAADYDVLVRELVLTCEPLCNDPGRSPEKQVRRSR
jgi:hypothetical protein